MKINASPFGEIAEERVVCEGDGHESKKVNIEHSILNEGG